MANVLRHLAPLVWLTVASVVLTNVRAVHWDHAAQLTDDFRLLWNIKRSDITFEMQVRTHGYVGLGFARSADRRAGADVIVGWVDDAGQTFAQDRHVRSNGAFEPAIDPSQDYTMLLGYENVTHTVMRFVRRLNTCDEPHDVPITNDTMRLLVIYHADDPPPSTSTAFGAMILPGTRATDARLSIRAVVPLQLAGRPMGGPHSGPSATSGVHHIELRNEELPLPVHLLGESLEWCRLFELNQFSRKHHMIRYEPVFGTEHGHRQLDALVLFECQGTDARLEQVRDNGGGLGRMCAEFRQTKGVVCEAVVASWTRGSEGLHFPPEAGYPFDSHKDRFYLLESHYSSGSIDNNGDIIDGSSSSSANFVGAFASASSSHIPMDLATAYAAEPLLDSSGLRLYVTPVLRPHDAGVMSIGMSPDWRHIIPPGQLRVISEGHCVAECTRRSLPATGISVFAVALQTHSIGTQVRLRHVRQHEELPPIAADAGVHEAYAEYRSVSPAARIMPGDNLIAECTYDSSGREAITLGSQSRRGESCLVLAVYYPRQKRMTRCQSLPSLPTVLHSLGIDELAGGSQPVLIAAPPPLAGMTLESRLVGYDWAHQFEQFERVTRGGSFEAVCMNARHKRLQGTEEGMLFQRPRTTRSRAAIGAGTESLSCAKVDVEEDEVGDNRLEAAAIDRSMESMSLSRASVNDVRNVWLVAVLLSARLLWNAQRWMV